MLLLTCYYPSTASPIKIVEVEEFLECVNAVMRDSTVDPLRPLLSKWGNRFPDKHSDTMITWSNVLEDRKLMVQRLEDHHSVGWNHVLHHELHLIFDTI